MFTACAFWMVKIITTMRATTPAISPVRRPLIRVCSRRRRGGRGADWGGGAEPLAEGRGRVMVVGCGAAGSVMCCAALLLRMSVTLILGTVWLWENPPVWPGG